MTGPLAAIRVVEFGNKGAIAQAGMMLGDLGADVIRLDRLPPSEHRGEPPERDWRRGRRSIAVDLKSQAGRQLALHLLSRADAAIEGFRPGKLERLGLGPADVAAVNPRLVFGRVTGWGRASIAADRPGHDLNYVAASGAVFSLGRAGQLPTVPVNLLGDGAGGMLLALGVLAGLMERQASGLGQVVDASMLDAATSLMTRVYAGLAAGSWNEERGTNYIDSGAPFYDVYAAADGRFLAVGAIETRFFRALLDNLGVDPLDYGEQWDRNRWSAQKDLLRAVFLTRDRDTWCAVFETIPGCVSPVLSPSEALTHPLNVSNGTFVPGGTGMVTAPVPRFGRTPGELRFLRAVAGEHTEEALADWGVAEADVQQLRGEGVIR
jgi:alpha-methylacyl-CoA racemase